MIWRISVSSFERFNLASVKSASERVSQGNGPGGGWIKPRRPLRVTVAPRDRNETEKPTSADSDRFVHWAYSIPDPLNLGRLALPAARLGHPKMPNAPSSIMPGGVGLGPDRAIPR